MRTIMINLVSLLILVSNSGWALVFPNPMPQSGAERLRASNHPILPSKRDASRLSSDFPPLSATTLSSYIWAQPTSIDGTYFDQKGITCTFLSSTPAGSETTYNYECNECEVTVLDPNTLFQTPGTTCNSFGGVNGPGDAQYAPPLGWINIYADSGNAFPLSQPASSVSAYFTNGTTPFVPPTVPTAPTVQIGATTLTQFDWNISDTLSNSVEIQEPQVCSYAYSFPSELPAPNDTNFIYGCKVYQVSCPNPNPSSVAPTVALLETYTSGVQGTAGSPPSWLNPTFYTTTPPPWVSNYYNHGTIPFVPSPSPSPSTSPEPSPSVSTSPEPSPSITPSPEPSVAPSTTPPDSDGTIPNPGASGAPPITSPGGTTNAQSCNQEACSNPVNLSTGYMWHELTDFSVAGRTAATSLTLQRTYLAQPFVGVGDFGPHWFSNWETKLVAAENTATPDLIWINPVGGALLFKRNSNGSFTNPASFFGSLVEKATSYVLTERHGITLTFSRNASVAPIGALLTLAEPHGEQVSLTYGTNGKLQTLSTALAGTVTFTRDPSTGYITQATRNRDNLNYNFTYQNGFLSTSSDVDGKLTHYAYSPVGSDQLLTQLTDPLGNSLGFTYDSLSRVIGETEPGGAAWSFSYSSDSNGPITKVVGVDGNTTTYHFNPLYLLTETDLPNGGVRKQTWTTNSQIASLTDELGYTTQYGYDARGNLNSLQLPEDPSSKKITYDGTFDEPTLIVPLSGSATQVQIDPTKGDVLGMKRAYRGTTLSSQYTVDAFGTQLSTNNGIATYSNATDPTTGLLTTLFDERNPETRTYDSRARLSTRTFKSGRVLTYSYDDYDRVTQVSDSNGPTTQNTYDVLGHLLTQTRTDGQTPQTTAYSYDSRYRLIQVTDASGNITTFGYDQILGNGTERILSQPTSVVDPKGNVTRFRYDSMDRLVQKIDANGGITKFGYDLKGNQTSITDPDGNQSTFEYDGNQRLIETSIPSASTNSRGQTVLVSSVTQYSYDASGKVILQETLSSSGGPSKVIQFFYDGFDRLIEKKQSRQQNGVIVTLEDDSTYTYSPELDANVLVSANNSVEQLSFASDSAPPFAISHYGVSATDPSNALTLIQDQYAVSRDITNQIAGVSDSASKSIMSASYDPAGRLTTIGSGNIVSSSLSATLTYDSFGRKRLVLFNQGTVGGFAYDNLNRPLQITWTGVPNGTTMNEGLSYDANSNITNLIREFGKVSYGYDPQNQVVGFTLQDTGSSPFSHSWQYDLAGNHVEDSGEGMGQFIANVPVHNGVSAYQNDGDGFGALARFLNPQTGAQKSFSYRSDGELISFEKSADTGASANGDASDRSALQVQYFFDALGRRVAKQITKAGATFTQTFTYLADQNKLLLASNGAGAVSLYLDGQGLNEHFGMVNASGVKIYVTDHLGSVINVLGNSNYQVYGPYGLDLNMSVVVNTTSDPASYGFAGMTLDGESGMYFDRARIYSPSMGRFTSRDPLGFNGGDVNPYRYVNNNAVNGVDPTGLFNDNSPKDPIPLSPQGVALVCNPIVISGLIVACYVTAPGAGIVVCPFDSEAMLTICTAAGNNPLAPPPFPNSPSNPSPEIPSNPPLPPSNLPPEEQNSCGQ